MTLVLPLRNLTNSTELHIYFKRFLLPKVVDIYHKGGHNKVHDNAGDGIDFSRFTYNSVAKNNIVYNEPKGIFITRSHNNQVYNNSVSNSVEGIKVGSGSNYNNVYGNLILNSKAHAILVDNGSSSNTFYSNKIVSDTKAGLKT